MSPNPAQAETPAEPPDAAALLARGPFVYREQLDERLAAATAQPKTIRTRLRLMLSVARLLEQGGLHALRVADCAAEAGLAHGTFYRYWPDGSAAAEAVLSDFMTTVRQRRPVSATATPIYDRIRAANRYYVRVYRGNAGLMRCLMQLGNAQPEFARIGQEANLALAARVVRAWERNDPSAAALPEVEKSARALACIAMVEGVLRDLYVRPAIGPLAAMPEDGVADMLSACWFRTLFGRDPPTR
ncbi:TetR/AcrR family transcriptional regulator [Falsiroseomonas sp.]|uniref:TetR/AcrR family transcriptional regulator n=1 Tax=Falsiroseomonas sp. TaxID=2870721 RepID=UPI0027157F8A|nr:TetR/AcrR family transcriptional regulator [Falsiroseomonas sp.]MDO9499151.1 TetR/AcrR family transcriptional regulator [Falsiroseomonas sp.]MDP3415069.1 TetR/AcrR family transcriptional regulator [Falsiroseomonas sp.]